MLNFYRKLSALRRNPEFQDTFIYGRTEPVMEEERGIMAYFRRGQLQDILVAGNFMEEEKRIEIPEMMEKSENVLLSNEQVEWSGNQLVLKPFQVVVLSFT